ncbi:MAG TPA: hypothetical protein VLX30_12505 [Burkholderiales bacterium]|nr:hypothetical protein [Burkholderiales bacterium]
MDLTALSKKPLLWGIAAVLLLAAGLGAWRGYSGYRKTSLQQAVAPQLKAADARLREALGASLEPDPAQAEQAAAQLDATAKDIEARRATLRALDAAPDPARVESADEALDSVAAIVRQQAAVLRAGLAFTQAREALEAHMRGARARRGDWVSEAIELKHKMERAYFDYKFALDGLAARLGDVPDRDLAAQVRERIDAALKHASAARAAARRL